MTKIIISILLLFSGSAFAQDAADAVEKSVDQMISDAVAPIINPSVGFTFS